MKCRLGANTQSRSIDSEWIAWQPHRSRPSYMQPSLLPRLRQMARDSVNSKMSVTHLTHFPTQLGSNWLCFGYALAMLCARVWVLGISAMSCAVRLPDMACNAMNLAAFAGRKYTDRSYWIHLNPQPFEVVSINLPERRHILNVLSSLSRSNFLANRVKPGLLLFCAQMPQVGSQSSHPNISQLSTRESLGTAVPCTSKVAWSWPVTLAYVALKVDPKSGSPVEIGWDHELGWIDTVGLARTS